MDLKKKVERAKKAISSISQHDDASKDEVEKALSEVINFVANEDKNGLGGRDERIAKRAKERNDKLVAKRAIKGAK